MFIFFCISTIFYHLQKKQYYIPLFFVTAGRGVFRILKNGAVGANRPKFIFRPPVKRLRAHPQQVGLKRVLWGLQNGCLEFLESLAVSLNFSESS